MARYAARNAPRHAAPRRVRSAHATRSAFGRPVLASSLAAVVLTGGALAASLTGGTASAESLTFAVDGLTSSASTEQSRTEQEDAARVAADRSATNAQRSVAAARSAEREKVKAAALAKARKATAEKAARAAQRKRIIANAQKDPKAVARMLLPEYGFSQAQWSCLDRLWVGESDWRWSAENPSSGAYGIPQSLPARKMATVADDYRTNPVTQIKWGLDYIKRSYGTPCNALDQWNSRSPHWY
ncbi:MAG TPA: hypothetical protein VES93_08370 [Ornithinibacter sp.]|nr:hypothetical protein [Ornithinibacter sp.]